MKDSQTDESRSGTEAPGLANLMQSTAARSPETRGPEPEASLESNDYEPIETSALWGLTQRLLASFGCLVLLPALPILYLLVKLTSRGPFLFPQKRRGLGGKEFTIFKIRTLRVDAEQRSALGVDRKSRLITPVGGILRQLKIDELPQLINVVNGDMDLVGPRPIPVALEDELRKTLPGFRERNRVKPGLTSLSQIVIVDNAVGAGLIDDWSDRFQAERHYIRRKSFSYDVVVLVLSALYLFRSFARVVGIGRRRVRRSQLARRGPTATNVLGVPICNLDYDGVLDQVETWVGTQTAHYVGVCPVHNVVEAVLRQGHRAVLRGASLNTADGMPIVWAQKLLGHRGATRVYGPTLTLKALERAQSRGWSVGFYGGAPDRLETLVTKMQARYPELKVAISISPPYRALTPEEDAAFVEQINDAEPDLLFIGLGCPKQERWMAEHKSRLRCVMLGVGAAFDFHAGAVKQAPPLLQKIGMEWFFRLCCEPRRLFKRYATTNPIFVAGFCWQLAKHWIGRRDYQVSLVREPQREHEAGSATAAAGQRSS